ncbi:M23 family metallopeptidase [Arthrobacter sp. USHLN218]|uniref:M23 family metallopeptidase n=1 Tax=Arthrobacter sp. USHLN218 TaxID=3081232 RepID=UPI0030163C80
MNSNSPMRGRRRNTDTSLIAIVRGNRAADRSDKKIASATRGQKFSVALAAAGILALAAVPTAQAGAEQLAATQASNVTPATVTVPEDAKADLKRVEVISKAAPKEAKMEVKAASVKDAAKQKKEAAKKAAAKGLVSPVQKMVTSSGFGYRINPVTGAAGEFHNGLDFALGCGTPVNAAAAGTVSKTSSSAGGYGNRIVIKHAGGMTTTYNHLQSIGAHKGQKVSAGDKIGVLGTTGNSTGCHLHFEVLKGGSEIDPAKFF